MWTGLNHIQSKKLNDVESVSGEFVGIRIVKYGICLFCEPSGPAVFVGHNLNVCFMRCDIFSRCSQA